MNAGAWPQRLTLGSRAIEVRTARVGAAGAGGLSLAEGALESRGKTDKRRAEFRAGRIAARAAISAVSGPFAFDVLASPEGAVDAGRPVVTPARDLAISISHASGLAVAVAAFGAPLGVDLEALALSPEPSFADDAFAEGELGRWAFAPAPLPFAWAAKEAMLKTWGVGLRAPLGLVSLAPRVVRTEGDAFFLEIEVQGPAAPGDQRRFEGWAGVIEAWVMVVLQHAR